MTMSHSMATLDSNATPAAGNANANASTANANTARNSATTAAHATTLANAEEEGPPMTWMEVKAHITAGNVHKLRRSAAQTEEYRVWRDKTLEKFGSVSDYLRAVVFGSALTPQSDGRLVAVSTSTTSSTVSTSSRSRGSSSGSSSRRNSSSKNSGVSGVAAGAARVDEVAQEEEEETKMVVVAAAAEAEAAASSRAVWRANDFPYHFEPGIEHHILWFESGVPSTERIAAAVHQNLGAGYETASWVNPPALQSVRGLGHAHILSVRRDGGRQGTERGGESEGGRGSEEGERT